jgi:Zn-dependent M28 family amino/carboxypeptidase
MALFDGQNAFEHVRAQVELGPRPPGSAALGRLRDYVSKHLTRLGWGVEEQPFEAVTPNGKIAMVNLLARYPPGELPGPGAILLGAHADTKVFDFEFLGANDGGSGVACLLELGRVVPQLDLWRPTVLAFFDGEEAQVAWGRGDGLYGSRQLVGHWWSERRLADLLAVVILDIVGDRELRVTRDLHSTAWLQDLVWEVAWQQGMGQVFEGPLEWIEDDHLPFLAGKVASLVLIGFGHDEQGEYFPSYWHTPEDTLDKVSPLSLEQVGRVVEEALIRLQGSPPRERPGA